MRVGCALPPPRQRELHRMPHNRGSVSHRGTYIYIYITHRRNASPHKYIRGADLQRCMGLASNEKQIVPKYRTIPTVITVSIDRRTTRRGVGGSGLEATDEIFFPRFRDLMSSFYRIVKIKVRVYRNKYIG